MTKGSSNPLLSSLLRVHKLTGGIDARDWVEDIRGSIEAKNAISGVLRRSFCEVDSGSMTSSYVACDEVEGDDEHLSSCYGSPCIY